MLRQASLLALAILPAISSAQISNDFESGWDQTVWPIYTPDCNQGGNVSLDSTKAHSGKNSMKVVGAGGYCGHAFFGTTKVPTGDVYVRTWFQASTALTSDHVSFIVMPDSAEGTNEDLRFGGMDEIMIYNRESDDATLPDLSPQGIATSVGFPAGSWQCLEYHLGTDGTIETWLNGAAIAGLTVKSGVTNDNDSGWTRSAFVPKISGVYFGWESYGNAANTFWYDDIAISSTRVGCGSSTSSGSTGVASPTSSSMTMTGTTGSAATTTLTTSTTASSAAPSSTCAAQKYAQCGGTGWSGCTVCASGSTCKYSNPYYSQCL